MRRKLAAMAFAALSAWLGGAVDAWLVHAHAALARNVGQSAKVWAMGAESGSSASTTLPGTPTAVILGYSLAPDGSAGPGLAARARAGADLYASGAAPALIFSGGHPGGGLRGGRSEAGVAAGVAAAHLRLPSVPPAWRLEEASTSTWENALLSLRMMGGGGGAIIVVTSPFHLGRAARTFARAAAVVLEGDAKSGCARPFTIFAHAPPVDRPTSPAQRATATYEAVREVAALAWYWVRGRLA
jgi:uncharacterized SAM-binding protein YcdF (DUF218 family)